jgi:dihydrodipicolinate synthase/N-acetylneuraminate lyase
LKTAREACAPHKVLIAGTGAESALETLRLTEYAASLGYDAALVRTPFFYKPQLKPANILAFYRTVADHSPVPILIYSVPVFTGYDMPPELVIELANHPNIIGIKESGGDAEKIGRMVEGTKHIKRNATVTVTFAAVTSRMMKAAQSGSSSESGELVSIGAPSEKASSGHVGTATLGRPTEQASASSVASSSAGIKTRQKEVGFQVLAGTAQRLLSGLEAGAVGAVLAFATPAPTACYEIYTAWKEGDAELARLKQQRVSGSAVRVASELGIPALKYVLDLNGYYGGPPRLPLLPLTGDLKREVEELMADMRN